MSYNEKNKIIRLNYQKQYYQVNRDKIKSYTKKYYELNKDILKTKRKNTINNNICINLFDVDYLFKKPVFAITQISDSEF